MSKEAKKVMRRSGTSDLERTKVYRTLFTDDFSAYPENSYPDSWICEASCELPYKQGFIRDGVFHIAPISLTSRHIPRTPELANFKMQAEICGNPFFGECVINLYFRYKPEQQKGLMIRYQWGITGNKTNYSQVEIPEYTCELLRFCGKPDWERRQLSHEHLHLLERNVCKGFIKNLAHPQKFILEVHGREFCLTHDRRVVGNFHMPDGVDVPDKGMIAFSREDMQGDLTLSKIRISAEPTPLPEKILRPESKTEFPRALNGMISPFYYHIALVKSGTQNWLKLKLTGGPSKEPIYPEIDRQRFGEKLTNPYVRFEDANGSEMGRYLIFHGEVGLNEFYWNRKCTVLNPADATCPLQRNVPVGEIPAGTRIYIGYEKYFAEDSICHAGGPTETLIDEKGLPLWTGSALKQGEVQLHLSSPEDKAVCKRIPKDIPMYEDALQFARQNHFFLEGEPVQFQLSVLSREQTLREPLYAAVTVEDVFGRSMDSERLVTINNCKPHRDIPGANGFSSDFFVLPELPVGVYHIRAQFQGIGGKPEERHAFEVMPADAGAIPAPLASGLPELYPNILSGICNEHFHCWSHTRSDTIHYNSGGNNYFKVARQWRAPELLKVYGRKWICWLKPWVTIFAKRGIEDNIDLIAQSTACHKPESSRKDLWRIEQYNEEYVFQLLLKFLKERDCRSAGKGSLSYDKLVAAEKPGLSEEQFFELFDHHWKEWLLFFSAANDEHYRKTHVRIQQINPDCELIEHGGNYWPPYGSGYKLAYFALHTGRDLRMLNRKFISKGPNSFENYPFSSGYPTAHGICQLMAVKLEAPELKLFPEMFGINGETLDNRVVLATPPYGQSDPPYGFMIKQFYEYAYAVVWFDKGGFQFWNDHGYHAKAWDRENYQEMLYAYEFISRTRPLKPLRAPAYAYSRDACLNTPDFYEKKLDSDGSCGAAVNSAEEAIAFSYEQARSGAVQAGFLFRLEDCDQLKAEDVGLLVLPPLRGIDNKTMHAIRALHTQGVALLGFEEVAGLEDLFGVEKADMVTATEIFALPGKFRQLDGLSEKIGHPLCTIRYENRDGETILSDISGAPVLVRKRTEFGKTALFTLPPTFVKRARNIRGFGQKSNSILINRAMAIIQKDLADNAVETSEGALLAFRDPAGNAHVIVSEDRCPLPGAKIRPLVTIKIPGIKEQDIHSDKPFEILQLTPDFLQLRLSLHPDQAARIEIKNSSPRKARKRLGVG